MPSGSPRRPAGLPDLRRAGAITELLFLYESTTRDAPRLRPIAERLGLTVQATSHAYRQLARRGLAEVREGRYRPTVAGVAWLHSALGTLRDDVRDRLNRLHVIRSCRAIARERLDRGIRVSLEMHDGLLWARKGSRGASRGRTAARARAGELVPIVDLEGIVAIERGRIRVVTVPADRLMQAETVGRIRQRIRRSSEGLLGAFGAEPYHLLRRATDRPVVRYGVGPAFAEASHLGVGATVVVLEEELARFLESFAGPDPPPIEVSPLDGASRRR